MKRKIVTKKIKKYGAIITSIMLTMTTNITAFAAEDTNSMKVDIGGITVDVEQIAEKNNVNPHALKAAIESGKNAEKASPFSNLVSTIPNTNASGKVEYSMVSAYNSRMSARGLTKVSKTNQDSTAYVAKAGALTASGKTPELGMCAMHTDVTTKTGSTSSTKVKLGTRIYMENSVNVNGTNYTSFLVEDRGKPSNRTKYWIDIYFGINNTTNYNAAINYGVKTVSYYYYY